MKKLTVVLTAILCCSLAYSQEVDIRIIPRADVNTYVPINNEGSWAVDFGNTSLYTLVEGTFLENFSYSVANHWVSIYGYEKVGDDLAGLYVNSLYSDANNWLDWANLTYTLSTENAGSFDFTAGKNYMFLGSYENDAYDFDSHFGLNSLFWNNAVVYQWGGSIGYTTPSEMTTVYLQANTSPFGGMMFKDKQYGAYSLCGYGEYGFWSPIWSTNFIQRDEKDFINIIALGNQFHFGDFTLGLDWMNRAAVGQKKFFGQEQSINGLVSYNFGDKVDLTAKAGAEFSRGGSNLMDFFYDFMPNDHYTGNTNYIWGGLGVNYYPLKDSQDLRIHAVISANNWANEMSVNVGVTYNFSVFSR